MLRSSEGVGISKYVQYSVKMQRVVNEAEKRKHRYENNAGTEKFDGNTEPV